MRKIKIIRLWRENKMKYKAAIFDLDGTLLNTLEDLWSTVNHTMDKYGYPHRTIKEVRAFVGKDVQHHRKQLRLLAYRRRQQDCYENVLRKQSYDYR